MAQRSFTRDPLFLLPVAIEEWLPATHAVRFVDAFVHLLPEETWAELGVVQESERRGAPRDAPELLLMVVLAGFMQGIRTARKREYACRYDLSFRWLSAGQTPDHNTLWRFYAAHRKKMRVLLNQTVRVAVAADPGIPGGRWDQAAGQCGQGAYPHRRRAGAGAGAHRCGDCGSGSAAGW